MAARSWRAMEIAATSAALSVILAGIVLYVVYRLRLRRQSKRGGKLDCSFRREYPTAAPGVEFRQRGAAVKGIIVDEEGMDVLYLRKLDGGGHMSGCFNKVWYNPMMEEVKRMDCREEKPSVSEPIQELPLLKHPRNVYEVEVEKKNKSPPSPPPTPLNALPPPPPPPPPPPGPPKGRPPPARRVIPSHKPPTAPRVQGNKVSRGEDSDTEKMQENGVSPATKLKPLHWDKVVMANADHSMVWNEINDGSFRFDDEQMEALFGYNNDHKTKKPSNLGSSNAAAPSLQTFILDPRKSQNTAIILKSLAISRKEVLDSLMEGRGLNSDTLEKLTKICPTQEETVKILQFDGNPTKLADAESFLYHILKAVPSAFVRFSAMLFRANYEPEILHLKESLQACELGCKELRNGGIFFKLLEAILKAGNRMNAGTNRGNAQGFNLTTLRRLSDVKSTNGKTTLLHFVVEQVVRSEGNRRRRNLDPTSDTNNSGKEIERECLMLGLPSLESLKTEFTNVKKAAAIDYDTLINTCSVLTKKVDEMKRLLSRSNDADPAQQSPFAREMKGFLEYCGEELKVVREEERRVIDLVTKTTVYYQTAVKGGNPLQLFVIVKDFLNNVDQVCTEITNKLQRVRGGNSSPPLSPTPRSPVRFQNLQNYFKAQRLATSSSDSDDDF